MSVHYEVDRRRFVVRWPPMNFHAASTARQRIIGVEAFQGECVVGKRGTKPRHESADRDFPVGRVTEGRLVDDERTVVITRTGHHPPVAVGDARGTVLSARSASAR